MPETFSPEMKDLLLRRMEARKKAGSVAPIYTIADGGQFGRSYTPDQMIDEARRGSSVGEEFLFAEKRFMDELERRRIG